MLNRSEQAAGVGQEGRRGQAVGSPRVTGETGPHQPIEMLTGEIHLAGQGRTQGGSGGNAHDALEVGSFDEKRKDIARLAEVDGSKQTLCVEDETGIVITALLAEGQGVDRQLLTVGVPTFDEGDSRLHRQGLAALTGIVQMGSHCSVVISRAPEVSHRAPVERGEGLGETGHRLDT